jgi:hypothetical protein
MIALDELERLAKSAGGDAWTPTYATRIDLAAVWLPDGDSVCRCYGNIGHLPEPIDADLMAEYIAATNPANILALTAEVRRLRAQQYELMGVVADVEVGRGFDAICLKTIKRVIGVLGGAELRTCPKCGVKNLPAGTYCKGIACPLNPSHPSEAA